MSFYIQKYNYNRCFILQDLPGEEIKMLEEKMVKISVSKNAYLYKEGTFLKGIYFLESGKVKIFKASAGGKEYIVHIYTEGESFGYRSVLSGEHSPVNAMAMEDLTISFISAENFMSVLHSSRMLPIQLLSFLSNEFPAIVNQVSSFTQRSAHQRVALSLLILFEKSKSRCDADSPVEISVSRNDLANYAGTTTETFVRMLRQLKEENVIRTRGRKILVLDPVALEKKVEVYEA